MDPASVAAQIASHGLLGLLLIAVTWAYWRKDSELKDERLARIADAKNYTELALKLQQQVIDSVNKLSEILDETRKLMVPPAPPQRTGATR